ncbi:hypothetical protein D9M71_397870 [compost metagenome]
MGALKNLRKTITSGNPTAKGAVQAALMQHRMFMGYLTTLVKTYIAFYSHVAGSGSSKEVAVRENGAVAKPEAKEKDDSVVATQ